MRFLEFSDPRRVPKRPQVHLSEAARRRWHEALQQHLLDAQGGEVVQGEVLDAVDDPDDHRQERR